MVLTHVVTHRRWIADELALGGPVRHHHGFDLPPNGPDDAWWAPTEWMARALRSGLDVALAAPAPSLLPALRPDVQACRREDLPSITINGPVFAKIAEAKLEALPAQVWPSLEAFACAASDAGVPGGSWLHLTRRILEFDVEVRCFMLGREPVAASTYLVDGQTEGWASDPWLFEAAAFARTEAERLDDVPAGWVLDVGRTAGGWLTVEANPAWSSSPYDAEPTNVLRVLEACTRAPERWLWRPDALLEMKAARQRPLAQASTNATPPLAAS